MNRYSRGLFLLIGLGLLLGACGIKGPARPPLPPPPPPSETQPPPAPETLPPGQSPRGPFEPSGPGPQDAGS
jgi:hypothetical protein